MGDPHGGSPSDFFFAEIAFCGEYDGKSYLCLMSRTKNYQIPYTNACIRAFGRRFDMSTKEAYQYLRQYRGIDFLIEFYETEHLLSIEDAVDDLIICCQNNGGHLS